MKAKGRTLRVGALIKEEIAKLIMKGIKDPRIGFVSVMDVRMSADLRYANVYVSLYGSEAERKSSLVGLQHSAGWVRREVGKYLHMRMLPEIRFFPDDTLDKVYHLQEVFDEIHAEQKQQPMLALSLEEAVAALRSASRFYIAGHTNPDGDCVGSMLALRLLLLNAGVTEITCALDGTVPAVYKSLAGAAGIVNASVPPPDYEVAVLVDCGQISRTGDLARHIPPGKRILIFDHHQEPGEPGASGVIETRYAATGELVADVYKTAQAPLAKEAAECLYAAVATDTGCFRFGNTTAYSHRLAGELIEAGIDVGVLNKRFFSDMGRPKFELMRRALEHVEFYLDGAIALSWLTDADLKDTGARNEDVENLVNLWQVVESVRVAILLKAFEANKTHVSFRSDTTFNSAAFLRQFGGGGHPPAAGVTLDMPLEEARSLLLSALLEQETTPKTV